MTLRFSQQCYMLMLQIFRACIVVMILRISPFISLKFFSADVRPQIPLGNHSCAKAFCLWFIECFRLQRDVQPKKVKPHNYYYSPSSSAYDAQAKTQKEWKDTERRLKCFHLARKNENRSINSIKIISTSTSKLRWLFCFARERYHGRGLSLDNNGRERDVKCILRSSIEPQSDLKFIVLIS